MSPRPPREIAEMVDAVTNRDPDISVVDAVGTALRAGFLSIGTARSQEVHVPIADQVYCDRMLEQYVYVEEPGVPVLQVTWSGKIAVMCGVFGDINQPEQRQKLGIPLTAEKYPYGWYGKGETMLEQYGYEDMVGTQADTRLLAAVRRHHDTITGAIDLVELIEDDFYYFDEKPEPDAQHTITRPGIILTQREQHTVATLPVFGSDLWATGIVPLTNPSDM